LVTNRLRLTIIQSLHRLGLHDLIARYARRALPGLLKNRGALGERYILRGTGIEIGALHNPLTVGADATVRYVDRMDFESCVARYPELDPETLVYPDIVDDGFELSSLAHESYDFVIANHVLEHSPNPVQVLKNWCRVLKPGGLVFVSVPIARTCFDRDRLLTTVEHILEDYALGERGEWESFRQRNLDHYLDWVRLSRPRILEDSGRQVSHRTQEEIERHARLLWNAGDEIHFHTFSESSFKDLLEASLTKALPDHHLHIYAPLGGEIVAILKKVLTAGVN